MIVDDSFQAHLDTRVRGKRGRGAGVGERISEVWNLGTIFSQLAKRSTRMQVSSIFKQLRTFVVVVPDLFSKLSKIGNVVFFLKLVYQNKNELPGTSMAFTMIVSRFEKGHCLLKSSVPLPWQPNLIKTLPTGVISKLMIQTRKPIPTYILLNPVSLLWTWHFKHSVYATSFPFPWIIIFL